MQSHGLNIGGSTTLTVGPPGGKSVNTLVLPANPDQTVSVNIRTTVVQTYSGLYLDKFGPGVQGVTLSGTTAWASPVGRFNGRSIDGNTAARHLYRDVLIYHEKQALTSAGSEMRLYDDVANQAWVVEPVGTPSFQRTQQSPLILYYSIQFVVIRDLITGHQIQKAPDPIITTFSSAKSIGSYSANRVATARNLAVSQKQTPYVIRTVQSGETLYTIAQDYLPKEATAADVQAFMYQISALNNLSNQTIFVGENLKIPA